MGDRGKKTDNSHLACVVNVCQTKPVTSPSTDLGIGSSKRCMQETRLML